MSDMKIIKNVVNSSLDPKSTDDNIDDRIFHGLETEFARLQNLFSEGDPQKIYFSRFFRLYPWTRDRSIESVLEFFPDARIIFYNNQGSGMESYILGFTDKVNRQENLFLKIELYGEKKVFARCAFIGKETMMQEKIDKLETLEEHPADKGHAYVIASTNTGLSLTSVGKSSVEFIPENYGPETVSAYEHIVKDLNSKDPCGRLVILDGPPGCGKTYLIRSIMDAVDSTFVVLPPNLVSQITGPNIVKLFANYQVGTNDEDSSVVLIIEDADECLATRAADNMGAISSLLNISDGIIASAFDIRVIATTNAIIDSKDIDKAILRDGRLCSRSRVGPLSVEQAKKVVARLGGNPEEVTKSITLAEAYKLGKKK